MQVRYGREDHLPLFLFVTIALQHVLSLSAFLVFPILVGRAAGVDAALLPSFLSTTLIAMGIANLLQASRVFGSGYLCPAGMTATHLGPSLIAARLGGLPLVFGMTLFAGLCEGLLSRWLTRLRVLFPPEVTGVVILMVGISNAVTGFQTLFPATREVAANELLVGAIAGGTMIAATVFGYGRVQLLCGLVGIVAGYFAAFVLGVVTPAQLASLRHLPLLAVPDFSFIGWSFSPALVLPFTVAAVAATVKQAGFIDCAAQIEGDVVRSVPQAVRRGVMADALGTMCAGLVGGLGVNVSASSSGLISATNVSTRRVGYGIGALLIALGFQPHFGAFLAIVPHGIVAAVLIFTSIFVLANGMEMIIGARLDRERTICMGLAVLAGVGVGATPGISGAAPAALVPFVSSSLVTGTTIAVLLNALFTVRRFLASSLAPSEKQEA